MLRLTKSQHDTLLNMISGYYPYYMATDEPLTKAEKEDMKNARFIKEMFGLPVTK